MTDEEANELLRNNEWSKWSDARGLLQEAAHIGWTAGYDHARRELLALVAAERVRWTEAVMGELDGNGQAQAIVAHATRPSA